VGKMIEFLINWRYILVPLNAFF